MSRADAHALDFNEIEYNWRVQLGLSDRYEFWHLTDYGDYCVMMREHYRFIEKANSR